MSLESKKALAEHAAELQQMLFGLTIAYLRKLSFDLAKKLNIDHQFKKESKKADWDWLSAFLKRHPELAVRLPNPQVWAVQLGLINQMLTSSSTFWRHSYRKPVLH